MALTEKRCTWALGIVLCFLLVSLVLGSIAAFFPRDNRLEESPLLVSQSAVLGHEDVVRCLAFAPDGKSLAVVGGFQLSRGEIKLWNLVTATVRTSLQGNQNGIYAAGFAPDGRTLATASFDQTLTLWDVASGRARVSMPLPLPRSICTALAPDGKTLAVAGQGRDSRLVRLWPVATERAHPLTAASGPYAFSVDSQRLALWRLAMDVEPSSSEPLDSQSMALSATFGDLPSARVWEIPTEPETMTLRADSKFVWALAFSPDGRTLASGGFDGIVKLWDVASGQQRATLRGHTDQVAAIAFAPDGQLLASASYDGTVRLWEPATGKELAILGGHMGTVTCVAFAPDGQSIASGSHDRTVRLWSLAKSIPALTN